MIPNNQGMTNQVPMNQYPYMTQAMPPSPYQSQSYFNNQMGTMGYPSQTQQYPYNSNASLNTAIPLPTQTFTGYPPSPMRQDIPQQGSTPASPVHVNVQIDNSKKNKKKNSTPKKHRKHDYSSYSSSSEEESSESEYISRKKSHKMRKSLQPVAKRLFKDEKPTRFTNPAGLKTDHLLAEVEETIDSIEMALESNESTKIEQNTLEELISELEKRKEEFKAHETFEDLIFTGKKLAESRSLSIAKANRLGDEIEGYTRIWKKDLLDQKTNHGSSQKEKKTQEGVQLLNLTSSIIPSPPRKETINIPFSFTNAEQNIGFVEGQKSNLDLEKSLNLLKQSMMTASQTFSKL